MTPQRERLRLAIEAWQDACKKLEAAQDVQRRGLDYAQGVKEHFGRFADVPDRIASHRAGKMVAFAQTGGDAPAMTLPGELIQARQDYHDAREQLDAARVAAQALAGTVEAAEQAVAKADMERRDAVTGVLHAEMDTRAEELEKLEKEAGQKRILLLQLPHVVSISARVRRVINSVPENVQMTDGRFLPGGVLRLDPAPWNAYRAALGEDAVAVFVE